jgi:hypothetical protein
MMQQKMISEDMELCLRQEERKEGESTTAANDNDDAVWNDCHDGILWCKATQTR